MCRHAAGTQARNNPITMHCSGCCYRSPSLVYRTQCSQFSVRLAEGNLTLFRFCDSKLVLDFCHTTALCAIDSVGTATLCWAVLPHWENFILGCVFGGHCATPPALGRQQVGTPLTCPRPATPHPATPTFGRGTFWLWHHGSGPPLALGPPLPRAHILLSPQKRLIDSHVSLRCAMPGQIFQHSIIYRCLFVK